MDLQQYRAGRDRVGQGTMVEQARATESVRSAVFLAKQFPRFEADALRRLREACGRTALAEKAFFSFRRGGQAVTGPTIHLAREVARCWGNIDCGLVELRRDDEYRQSEMQAFAWDLEANARVSTTFIVPHTRTAKGETVPLTDSRDVYENNTNAGARRLREQLWAVIPGWFRDAAEEACMATLTNGGGKPFAERQAEALKAWEKWGISRDQLEQQRDRPVEQWSEIDLAQLLILERSLRNREITREEAFPPKLVTEDDIRAQGVSAGATRRPPRYGPVEAADAPLGAPEDAGDGQVWPQVVQPGGAQ